MASKTIFIFLFIFLSSQFHFSSEAQNWVKAGYWEPSTELPVQEINSALFTHLLCAFADVNSSTYQLSVPTSYEQLFSTFTTVVKRKNPSVKTLISVWNGQSATATSIAGEKVNDSILSSMVSDSSKRKSFIDSSIDTARRYGFDGVDMLWLWPNSTDLAKIGVLLDEWRVAMNSEPRKPSESRLLLTIAVRYLPTIEVVSYPIDSISRNVDWAHVVAYDYHLPTRENFTGLHAALYNPSSNISTDFGIREWLNRGFPPSKLVLGLPYHGWIWRLVGSQDNVGAPASGPGMTTDGSYGYKSIKSYIRGYGYGAVSVYNATYVVNLFTKVLPTLPYWINFDDVESVKAKVAYAREKGLAGYNAFQLNNDDNWELSRAAQEGDKQENKHWLLLKIILPVSPVFILAAAMLYCFRRRNSKRKGEIILRSIHRRIIYTSAAENFGSDAHLQVFRFANIKAATNDFSNENKLGEGGFGPVYKGKLPGGQEIAVKRLSTASSQGLEEFQNEVLLTARLQHVNLVRVLGYCTEEEEKILIYEYMPNKSLDLYLFDPIRRHMLDWARRVRIIEGITQGLLYLQEYSNVTVIHRDIKASNVLLDDEMNPKISDFGMARLFKKDVYEANTGRIVGTYGYVPPEYVTKGIYSVKHDIYSYGVLLLQIISGKRNSCYYGQHENLNLLEYAYELWIEDRGTEFIESSLDDSSSTCKTMRCMQIALLCVQENPEDRPSMLEVFTMLRNDSTPTTPKRPAFSVKPDKNRGSSLAPQQEICSFNDPQISELEPR